MKPRNLNPAPTMVLVYGYERSSPFPANLIAAQSNEETDGRCGCELSGKDEVRETSRRAEPSVDSLHSRRAEPSVDNGDHYEVWTWNPPGYGRSSGRASLTKLVPAAEAFASQVTQARSGANTQIWLCGNSLGCLPALSLAARLSDWLPPNFEKDQCLLWLRNPPDLANTILSVADRYASRSWMQRLVDHLPIQLNAHDNAAKCEIPAVFLMSEHDELVPPPLQRSIHEAYGGAYRVVTLTDIGHGGAIDEQHRDEVQSAANWLLKAPSF